MILKKVHEVEGAAYNDLRLSLAWWRQKRHLLGRASEMGPSVQLAMIQALETELRRRESEGEPS